MLLKAFFSSKVNKVTMNWYRFIGYCIITITFLINIAARHKTQPTRMGQIIKEIAFLFVFDLFIATWVPIPFGMSLYLVSRLNNNLIWNIKDESIRKKFLIQFGILWVNFTFIHAQENQYTPGTFGSNLLYYYLLIICGMWIVVGLLFLLNRFFYWISNTRLNGSQWADKISHWRIGFAIYCVSASIGLSIVFLVGLITNWGMSGIYLFILFHILTFIYSIWFYRQIPRYCPPAPLLSQKKCITSSQSNPEASETRNITQDEMTNLSPEAKYKFQGFTGGELKLMDKPAAINYPIPTNCPICKNLLTFNGICNICNKKICPRCFNAETINARDCRNCAFIFETRKKTE